MEENSLSLLCNPLLRYLPYGSLDAIFPANPDFWSSVKSFALDFSQLSYLPLERLLSFSDLQSFDHINQLNQYLPIFTVGKMSSDAKNLNEAEISCSHPTKSQNSKTRELAISTYNNSATTQTSSEDDKPQYPTSWRFAIMILSAGSAAFLVGYVSYPRFEADNLGSVY